MKYMILYFLYTIIVITNAIVFDSSVSENKLICGGEVAEGEMSFVVSLRIHQVHFCSGCLISESHVLTVAKCAVHIFHHGGLHFEYTSVLIGTNKILSNKSDHAIRMVDAYGFIPDWPLNIQGYGMGVIMLLKPFFDLNASWLTMSERELTGEEITTVIGWSFKNNTSNIEKCQSNVLKIMNVEILEKKHCMKTFPQGEFELRETCGIPLSSRKNTSLKDIGSPLIVKNDEGEPELAGFVTAILQKKSGDYIRFNKVSFYRKYIDTLLEGAMDASIIDLTEPINEFHCQE